MRAFSMALVGALTVPLLIPFAWGEQAQSGDKASAPTARNDQAQSENRPRPSLVGRRISPFTLNGPGGVSVNLEHVANEQVVIAFLGTECPLALSYAPTLERLAKRFPDVAFVGVMPNVQDSEADVATFVSKQRLGFPVVMDPGCKIADRFGAKRTPEVFLLDRNRVVRYFGRVDDQYGVAIKLNKAKREHLAVAIEELKAGKPVSFTSAEAVGCLIGRSQRSATAASVTWAKDVAAIVQRRCQDCHRPGDIGPFPLLTYEDAVGWAPMIGEVVAQRRMPPWYADPRYGEFINDCRLSQEECDVIARWVAEGAPEGDASKAPPPRRFESTFRFKPDVVLKMGDNDEVIPAQGQAYVKRFIHDPKLSQGRWVKSIECRPGNRAVVHHIGVFLVHPSADEQMHWAKRMIDQLWGYSPGVEAFTFPKGMAKYIPAGCHVMFEVHYVPIGSEQTDRSEIALVYEDEKNVTKWVKTIFIATAEFKIPPYESDYIIDYTELAPLGGEIVGYTAHGHFRCKSFFFEAIYPNASRETLLVIPDYDLYWQQSYYLKKAKPIPPGTRLRCVAHYDNSAGNPRNSDPSATVVDGDLDIYGDEMMNGFVMVAEPRPATMPVATPVSP